MSAHVHASHNRAPRLHATHQHYHFQRFSRKGILAQVITWVGLVVVVALMVGGLVWFS